MRGESVGTGMERYIRSHDKRSIGRVLGSLVSHDGVAMEK